MRNKLTIITPVLNAEKTIEETIQSVLSQDYPNIEYIVVDGGSLDGTKDILNKYRKKISLIIFEPKKGVYTAMNRGLEIATGKIIGILNADDVYSSNRVISEIVSEFERKEVQAVWSDIAYVKRTNPKKIIRYWKSSSFSKLKILLGWMPPHPALFILGPLYKKLKFNENYKISADYDLSLRLFNKKIKTQYLTKINVYMRSGGESGQSISKIVRKTYEDILAWKSFKGYFDPFTLVTITLKKIQKIPQFFILPKNRDIKD